MRSTPIYLLAFGLLIIIVTARPWYGQSHESSPWSQNHHGQKLVSYRVPNTIRLPAFLAAKLSRGWPTFNARKVLHDKYLLISPALLFRIKNTDNDTDTSTTVTTEKSTVNPTISDIDESSTIETTSVTTESNVDDSSTTEEPVSFKKVFFSSDNDEPALFA